MSRTYRMKNVSFPNYNPEIIAAYYNKTVYEYLIRHFGDKRAGERNAPAGFRREAEKSFRLRAKQTLRKADDFESVTFEPFKHNVNYNYW